MATAVLTHALAAADRGLAVIPLSRTKLPAIRSPHADHPDRADRADRAGCKGSCGRPGHGVYDATRDPDAIRELFAAAPWATGYGIACGLPPHRLIGLDLDVTHGTDSRDELERLAREHGFTVPQTITVLTPSGGRHLWLRGPEGVPISNSAGRLAPGIDVRGTGGYLVGPGSVTVHGQYRLAPGSGTRAPAPVPPALLRLLTPPPRTPTPLPPRPDGTTGGQAAALVRFVRAAPVGQRNARLFWAACRARESGHGDDLARALTQAAIAAGIPAREARTTVASAARHVTRQPAAR